LIFLTIYSSSFEIILISKNRPEEQTGNCLINLDGYEYNNDSLCTFSHFI
jgi:hypothetical protein